MPEPRFAGGLSAFADRYDAFVLDQWGVLHDGANPYPGAIAAVEELVRRGKKVALLSNSGRRAAKNRERMEGFGFDPAWFAAIVTSGEACWRLLHDRPGPPWDQLRRRCHLLTIGGDLGVVEGLDLELVDDPARADFILASGLETWQTPEDLRPVAEAGTARGLPPVCPNPDTGARRPRQPRHARGAFARIYEDLGDPVHYVGKPHRPIYEVSLGALPGIAPRRIVGIGDSLDHDIQGAVGA